MCKVISSAFLTHYEGDVILYVTSHLCQQNGRWVVTKNIYRAFHNVLNDYKHL